MKFLKKKTPPFYLKTTRFGKRYQIKDLNRHLAIIGQSGSGKTYSVIKPMISYSIQHKGVLVFDPKPDLTNFLNGVAQKYNKPIINFSLDKNFDAINPLTLVEDKNDIIEFCNYFTCGLIGIPTSDAAKYFHSAAKSTLIGIILFLKKKHPKMCSIPHIVALFLTAKSEQIIRLIFSDKEAKRAAQVLDSVSGDPKLLGSIFSTFTSFFPSLDTPTIFTNLISDEKLKLPNDPENPSVINLIFSMPKSGIYCPIYSCIIGLILKKMNKPGQAESAVIIDELPVLAIPSIQNILELGRSNLISFVYGIQDISQLISRYDKEIASSIITNSGSQLLFRCPSPETLKHFKAVLGRRDVEKISVSEKQGGFNLDGPTHNYSSAERDILREEELIKYKKGQCFGILAAGNERLIEHKRVNGQHYIKNIKPVEIMPNKNINEQKVYEQVYKDIEQLLKPKPAPSLTKKFNL